MLLHGDLLGQNILLVPGGAPCVIDWERACAGDPAYNLAVVTRGNRNPFQTNGGLVLLLDEYRRAGGCLISPNDVRLYELCMVTGWFLETVDDPNPGGERPDVHLAHIERLLSTAGVESIAAAHNGPSDGSPDGGRPRGGGGSAQSAPFSGSYLSPPLTKG